jgi:flagellar biosynthesis/type III secretory pathway M-ring protein FliF/YscJ
MLEALFAPIFFVVLVAVIGIAVVVARIRRRASTSVPRSQSDVAPTDAETEQRRKTG